MSPRIEEMIQKAWSLNFLTPEAKLVILAIILSGNTQKEYRLQDIDNMCKVTLADIDIGCMFLRNSIDLPTMKRFGITSRINISKDVGKVQLSKDWSLEDEQPSN